MCRLYKLLFVSVVFLSCNLLCLAACQSSIACHASNHFSLLRDRVRQVFLHNKINPSHPLSHISLGWLAITLHIWEHNCSKVLLVAYCACLSATMSSLKYRYEVSPQDGAICQGPLISGFIWLVDFVRALPVHLLSKIAQKWSCYCLPYTNIGVNHVLDGQPVQGAVEINVHVLDVVASCY